MGFSKYNKRRFKAAPPVKEGDEYEVVVESVGEKGDGIAKIEGFVVIIPGVQKGEKAKVKINAVRGSVSFAEVVEKLGTAEVPEEGSAEESAETEEDEEASESEEEAESASEAEDEDIEGDVEEESEEASEEEDKE